MGAQLYMSCKKGEGSPEGSRFLAAGRGHFALNAPLPQSHLESNISAINRKVEAELLEFLHEMHPGSWNSLSVYSSRLIGFVDVTVTDIPVMVASMLRRP